MCDVCVGIRLQCHQLPMDTPTCNTKLCRMVLQHAHVPSIFRDGLHDLACGFEWDRHGAKVR